MDAFLVKFNSAGTRQWGTYYGGSNDDLGRSCATDSSGNVYLAGETNSITSVSATGAHQLAKGLLADGFIAKFNSSGVRQSGTYYGGSSNDEIQSCATDPSGNVYLVGKTVGGIDSLTIATTGSHQNVYGGGMGDAFLVKFDSCLSKNTAAAPSSTPTLCINTLLANITIATTEATGIGSATGLPAGVNAAWASDVITISGTPTTAGNFTYNIPSTGGCGTVNATGSIVVNALPTAAAASSTDTLCINTGLAAITHATTGDTGISNYGINGANGLPAGVNATWLASTITISGTPDTAGTFNYSIPLLGGCGTVNATGTITVTDSNTVTLGDTTTLCENTVMTGITHTTTGATGISGDGVDGGGGLPPGTSATWLANTITISGTPTATGTYDYHITTIGGCGTFHALGRIIVNAATNTVAAASSTPALCISTVLTDITHATTGATGIGSAAVLPAGVNAAWA